MERMSEHTGLISSYQLLITLACTNTGGKMKGSHSRAADRCPFVLRHSLGQVSSFMQLGMLCKILQQAIPLIHVKLSSVMSRDDPWMTIVFYVPNGEWMALNCPFYFKHAGLSSCTYLAISHDIPQSQHIFAAIRSTAKVWGIVLLTWAFFITLLLMNVFFMPLLTLATRTRTCPNEMW